MNKKILDILHKWPKPYVYGTDLCHILEDTTSYSRYGIIKRAIHREELIPVRRDLYLLKNIRGLTIDTFEIAPIIYGPSHVSFESALSYYGWIPEAVRTTTCATIKRNKIVTTPIGVFSYEHVPVESFSLGIDQHQQDGYTLFIANPVKALADIIYTRKRSWESLDDLTDDLRIEPENFRSMNKQIITDLIDNYPSTRVSTVLKGLFL